MKKILFLLFFLGIGLPAVYAHPIILSSSPAPSSNVPAGTNQIVIKYSEAIEIEFSSIKVLDGSGNQIDNKDTKYFEDETSLVVTTPPLTDGIYTVSSKVLSKIDGHLVDEVFLFGVGNVAVPPPKQKQLDESIYFPEAASRFPGIIGQVVVLGAITASLFSWGVVRKKESIKGNISDLEKIYHSKFSSVTGVGLFLVFASNILMLVVQTIRLETSASSVLQTSFGSIWILRMAVTVVLLAIWFLLENKASVSNKKQSVMLGLSLILIGTTTIIGHGTASEQISAVILDYIHNLVASIWIGGVIFFGLILLPVFSKLDGDKKERLSLLMIPRFSSVFVIMLGVVIITGPVLLWLLEDDLQLLSQSYYGFLIIAKIIIASAMVGLGWYNQFKIQKNEEKKLQTGTISAYAKLKKSLKIEAACGIVLLGVVAMLTNSSLPTTSAQQVAQPILGLDADVFSENLKFNVNIFPFSSGKNNISITVLDSQNKPIDDLTEIKLKISNPQKNIPPLEIPLTRSESAASAFEGSITFGFSGKWNIQIQAQRDSHVNEETNFVAFVKPHISELKKEVAEYSLPVDAAPLYAVYDGDDTIWISDASKPRLWKFAISEKQFTFFEFDGKATIVLKMQDDKIWFTDTPDSKIGFFDIKTEQFKLVPLPEKSIPISLESDNDGNIWVALVDRHSLLKFDPRTNLFEEFRTPTVPSGPVSLLSTPDGNIWFAESQSGKIGVLEPSSGRMQEFVPDEPLKEPFALHMDQNGDIWISEHNAARITKFNTLLGSFKSILLPDPTSLPFGIVEDRFENLWIAQHTVDRLAIYDPHKDELDQVDIPTKPSFTQFLVSDKDGNIWFVEQRGNKLGSVTISEIPPANMVQPQSVFKLRYFELVSPLISAGVIATSLFFVKSIQDRRRLNLLVD